MHATESTKSTVQELIKTGTMSGIVTELAMALTTNNTHKLFGIRVINASGHSTGREYIISCRSFPFHTSGYCSVVGVHCKSFCSLWNINYNHLRCQRYSIPLDQKNWCCVKAYIWTSVITFLLLQGIFGVFINTLLTVPSHSLGQEEQLLCEFLQSLGPVPFSSAGFFPCKIRYLHWNVLSLLTRALTAT